MGSKVSVTISRPRPVTVRSDFQPSVQGKFLVRGTEKLYVCGATYGPFSPEADGSLAGRGQNAVPFTRSPGDALRDERLVWSTKPPVALASGLRFMDTPSVLARALV